MLSGSPLHNGDPLQSGIPLMLSGDPLAMREPEAQRASAKENLKTVALANAVACSCNTRPLDSHVTRSKAESR